MNDSILHLQTKALPDGTTFRQLCCETKRPFLFVPSLAAICYLLHGQNLMILDWRRVKLSNLRKSVDIWFSKNLWKCKPLSFKFKPSRNLENPVEISGNLTTSPIIIAMRPKLPKLQWKLSASVRWVYQGTVATSNPTLDKAWIKHDKHSFFLHPADLTYPMKFWVLGLGLVVWGNIAGKQTGRAGEQAKKAINTIDGTATNIGSQRC